MQNLKKILLGHWNTHNYILGTDASDDSHSEFIGFIPSVIFDLGTGILFWACASLFFATFGYLLKIELTRIDLIISFIIFVPFYFFYTSNHNLRAHLPSRIFLLISIVCLSVFSINLSNKFFDLSYDGQAYHQETIIALSQGWNPIGEQLSQSNYPNISFHKILNSYPKASEILQAEIFLATNQIESAKSLNFLFAIVAFCYSLSFFWRIKAINKLVGLIGALLVIVTPITIVQSLSFYIDLHVYYMLVSTIFSLGIFYISHKNHYLIPFMVSLILLWNMKVSAIAISGVIISGSLIYIWYTEKIWVFFKTLQVLFYSFILSFFVFGIHPYITNTLNYGHPFYPTMGKNSSDYVKVNVPESLFESPSPIRLITSIFAETSGARGEGKYHIIKMPFTFSSSEVSRYFSNNTIGAFGPIFGGIFIITLLAIVTAIVTTQKARSRRTIIYLTVILISSCTVVPVASYARFIPHLWLLPVFSFIYLVTYRSSFTKFLGYLLLILMILNLFLIGNRYFAYNNQMSSSLRSDLQLLKSKSEDEKLMVDFGVFKSNRIRFEEAEIDFTESSTLDCNTSTHSRILTKQIPESVIRICN
jgi:hypothetical protein